MNKPCAGENCCCAALLAGLLGSPLSAQAQEASKKIGWGVDFLRRVQLDSLDCQGREDL